MLKRKLRICKGEGLPEASKLDRVELERTSMSALSLSAPPTPPPTPLMFRKAEQGAHVRLFSKLFITRLAKTRVY